MVVNRKNGTRKVVAEEEIEDVDIDVDVEEIEDGEVEVAPEADGLLFEAEDVAELIAEVTGEAVSVDAESADEVTFTVGEDEFVVSAEGDEEILEACGTRKKGVKSSTRPLRRNVIKSSTRPATRPAARRPVARDTSKDVKASRTVRKITKR